MTPDELAQIENGFRMLLGEQLRRNDRAEAILKAHTVVMSVLVDALIGLDPKRRKQLARARDTAVVQLLSEGVGEDGMREFHRTFMALTGIEPDENPR